MTQPDVIVIGSGPAGVSATWPLLEAGLRVLMLDACSEAPLPNPPSAPDIGAFRRDPDRWKAEFGADLSSLQVAGNDSPKLRTPLSLAVLAGFGTAQGLAPDGFQALGSLRRGGLSAIWGGFAAIWDEADLAGFPIGRSDLLPSYAAVARRIGLSGGASGGVPVSEGPPLTAAPRRVLDAFRARRPGQAAGFTLERATNAVLMEDREDRAGCGQCGLCLWGCGRKSIYSSAFELERLQRTAGFSYRPGSFVTAIRAGGRGQVVAVQAADGGYELTAPRVVVAAGTIATTALVLRRLGATDRPVRLLTNPVAATAFIVPRLVGAPLPDRSFALAQLSYRLALAGGGETFGAVYGADALPLAELANRLPLSRAAALRFSHALAPALLLATCYLPGRFSDNTMRVGQDGVAIQGRVTAEARQTLRRSTRRLGQAFRALGAVPLPGSTTVSMAGADGHYAGTLPMNGGGGVGCSAEGEVHGCPGLYVADGSALTDLPAKHCTLTVMANADRIGRRLASRLAERQPAAPAGEPTWA